MLCLPVRFECEDKKLLEMIKANDIIESDIIKIKNHSKGKINYALAEIVCNRYKSSCIINAEAEKIEKDF